MTKKELEKQAKEFNVSVEQIKEWRKHIKPFLRFAIDKIKSDMGGVNFLCCIADHYCTMNRLPDELSVYLEARLKAVRPNDSYKDKENKNSTVNEAWWANMNSREWRNNKRIAFCKLQLKLVKP